MRVKIAGDAQKHEETRYAVTWDLGLTWKGLEHDGGDTECRCRRLTQTHRHTDTQTRRHENRCEKSTGLLKWLENSRGSQKVMIWQ